MRKCVRTPPVVCSITCVPQKQTCALCALYDDDFNNVIVCILLDIFSKDYTQIKLIVLKDCI